MSEIFMQEMTWPEIARAMADGADTVIIVATAQEQHGPHLPEGADYYWGAELARRVARELKGRALIAPVIPFGPNEMMMGFPGTISLQKETLLAILRDMCQCYARHGFKNAVLLTSHDADFEAISLARQEFRDAAFNVIAFDDFASMLHAIYDTARAAGIDVQAAGAHSGEFETSILLAAYPTKVHSERAERGVLVDLLSQPDFFHQDLSKVTPNGIVGDARLSTVEQGERYWAALTALVADFVKARLIS